MVTNKSKIKKKTLISFDIVSQDDNVLSFNPMFVILMVS